MVCDQNYQWDHSSNVHYNMAFITALLQINNIYTIIYLFSDPHPTLYVCF